MGTLESDCPLNKPSTFMENISRSFGFVPIPHPPISDKLYSGFLFPIDYLEKTQTHFITKQVASDLELFQLTDSPSPQRECLFESNTPSQVPMHEIMCQPSTEFGKLVLQDMCAQYTTNPQYLEETQTIIERVVDVKEPNIDTHSTSRFLEVWREIKEDRSFLEKHNYMEFVALEEFNKSRPFLHFYSAINIVSPVFSLAFPLVLMLLPFVLLQCWRVPISFSLYLDTLRKVAKQHFIGKILDMKMEPSSIAYVLLLVGMYLMQTYGQIISCIRFHRTIRRMNENLLFLKDYLGQTSRLMEQFCAKYNGLAYYADFCQDIHGHRLVIDELGSVISANKITPYGWSAQKLSELGHMFDCYYRLYSDMDYEESLRYSVGFLGYWDIMCGISRGLRAGYLGKSEISATFSSPEEEQPEAEYTCYFADQYYPPHQSSHSLVPNTIDLSRNLIITGINASGKTTLLKTTALNIIFTQQFGVGFYKSGRLTPFHHIHSYLNIPDTSGRDSLFQAESRRCKEILDKIEAKREDRHFCIFDELYSGTNPKEATKTASALLKYLAKRDNIRFILTTHYVGICDKFKKSRRITNCQMLAEKDIHNERFKYTYRIIPGICKLEGGVEVLKQMDYPAEIICEIGI